MGGLVSFLGASPARIQAMAIGLLAFAVVALGLAGWALFERARYFECTATTVALQSQVTILAGKIDEQNAAIARQGALGQRILAGTRDAAENARKAAAARAPEISNAEARATSTEKSKGCSDAWGEIKATGRAR